MRPKEMKAGASQLGSSSSPSFQSTLPALEASLLPWNIFLRLILLLPPWIPGSCGAVQSWSWPFQWEDWLQQSLPAFSCLFPWQLQVPKSFSAGMVAGLIRPLLIAREWKAELA